MLCERCQRGVPPHTARRRVRDCGELPTPSGVAVISGYNDGTQWVPHVLQDGGPEGSKAPVSGHQQLKAVQQRLPGRPDLRLLSPCAVARALGLGAFASTAAADRRRCR